ncbi:uncharacterized protein LOC135484644 [Lineus longissimus]|uniref:uncharacterized protein LOC135484644 n=1 Tax=Lineus longissimus TaxID=88925 RepID=UPI00315DF7F6
MSKSRVPPPKAMTIPRLELPAAVTSVKVGAFLERELKMQEIEALYHTDSMVVLGYISNDSKRFHVFVANRIQQIRDVTTPGQWRHVATESNPADIASRGTNAEGLINSRLWWKGPEFLQNSESSTLMMTKKPIPIADDDPEVKRSVTVNKTIVSVNPAKFASMTERFEYFSDWFRLKRAVALCLRYFKLLKNSTAVQGYTPVKVQEMQTAQNRILKITQNESFPREIQTLMTANQPTQRKEKTTGTNHVGKDSSLVSLDPFLDAKSILRVGGRIKHAKVSSSVRLPILLPRSSHITNLIIDHHHKMEGHAGRGITLNSTRQAGFWIVGGRAAMTTYIMKCVSCRKLRGTPCGQKMANLPEDRF